MIRYLAARRQAGRRRPCDRRPERTAFSGLHAGQHGVTGGKSHAQSVRTSEAGEHAGHRRDELKPRDEARTSDSLGSQRHVASIPGNRSFLASSLGFWVPIWGQANNARVRPNHDCRSGILRRRRRVWELDRLALSRVHRSTDSATTDSPSGAIRRRNGVGCRLVHRSGDDGIRTAGRSVACLDRRLSRTGNEPGPADVGASRRLVRLDVLIDLRLTTW